MKTVACVVVALAVAIVAAPAWAQGGFNKGTKTKDKVAVAKKDTHAKKDPLADAFVLPKGVVLRADQQTKFDKMKEEMEPKLRDALAQVEAAASATEKSKAGTGVKTVRTEIKTKIAQIVREPDPNLPKGTAVAKKTQPQPQPKKINGRRW
jgi:hypothetical protein